MIFIYALQLLESEKDQNEMHLNNFRMWRIQFQRMLLLKCSHSSSWWFVQFTAENGARIKWKLNILIFILLQLHAGCCILMKLGNYVKWALTWKGNVFVICWWMFLKTTAILVNINRYPHLNLTTDYISVFETLHWKTLSTIMINI